MTSGKSLFENPTPPDNVDQAWPFHSATPPTDNPPAVDKDPHTCNEVPLPSSNVVMEATKPLTPPPKPLQLVPSHLNTPGSPPAYSFAPLPSSYPKSAWISGSGLPEPTADQPEPSHLPMWPIGMPPA